MKKRSFLKNSKAISIMYDAVLFLVMVSLSGAILIPALQSNIAVKGSIDKQREHITDQVLNSLLVSRADNFSYKLGGDIIDTVVSKIGINTTSQGFYKTITDWLLAREQIHKNYANIIAENLGCQFKLPISAFGTNRFNIFTNDFDNQLKYDIKEFLDENLGDKYNYNFTALWHPIRGVNFGGDIYIGYSSPDKDCYVSKSSIMMPYKPQITVNGTDVIFTRYWFEENVLKKIPIISNITTINNLYLSGIPPYNDMDFSKNAVKENITELVFGFLTDGIYNESGIELFPGILKATMDYGFAILKNATINLTKNLVDELIGEAIGTADDIFGNIGGVAEPIFNEITCILNDTITDIVGTTYSSIEEGFDILEMKIKNDVINILNFFINSTILAFINFIFDNINLIDIYNSCAVWLFDMISINEAEVTLSIWERR